MLAILTTHPIQYQVPLWQALSKDGSVPFEVWYLSDQGTRPSFDEEFNQTFAWDLDTLAGYPSRFLKVNSNHNVARFHRLRLAQPLKNLLHDRGVKALWIQGWQVAAYWQAVWQANAEGIPVWLRGESNDLAPKSALKDLSKKVALKRFFSKIREFLYIGKANRRLYEQYGVDANHLHPAPYCVDNERFRRQAEGLRSKRPEIRHQWGIPEDSFCILFAGKFVPKKRPFDIVAAVSNLHETSSHKSFHLLFAGNGDLGRDLRKSCNVILDTEPGTETLVGVRQVKQSTRPSASFTGFLNQTEISKAYVAADCLVLPSDHRETWGLVVNEAMASGLPCIVSDACGCAEDLISPFRPDFCFPLGDIASIARSIDGLIKAPTEADKLRRQVDQFNVCALVETVAALYGPQIHGT